MKDSFENWTTADWMNLKLFLPDVELPILDEYYNKKEEIDDKKARSDNRKKKQRIF